MTKPVPSWTIRELEGVAELRHCEAVQCAVWGEPVPEVSATSLRAAQHAGALIAGAFAGETLLGFVYGFPSYVAGRVGQHSHLLAVLPEARGRGLGQALKWFQRDWCLARGVTHVTWTFDPVRAKNARLNLEHLGAVAEHYEVDFYGALGGGLNGDLPSDRLLAEWPLTTEPVAALAAGQSRPAAVKPSVTGLACSGDNEPQRFTVPTDARQVWLELPRQVSPETDFEHALRWRLALREVMVPLLASGYQVTRFVEGGYVLERN